MELLLILLILDLSIKKLGKNNMKNVTEEQLGYKTKLWLNQLKALDKNSDKSNVNDETNKKIMLYRLELKIKNYIPTFIITPVSVNLRKNGSLGKYNEYRYNPSNLPKYLETIDYGILRSLYIGSNSYHLDPIHYNLNGKNGAKIFAEIISTRRCFWNLSDSMDVVGPILALDSPRKANMDWQINDNATQQFICNSKEGSHYTIPTSPAWYIDLNKNSCGILESKIDNNKLALLLQSPPIEPLEAKILRQNLKEITAKDIALPKILPEAKIHQIAPTVYLHLTSSDIYIKHQFHSFFPTAELSYDYLGQKIEYSRAFLQNGGQLFFKNGEVIKVPYNIEEQKKIVDLLRQYNLVHLDELGLSSEGHPNAFTMNHCLGSNDIIDRNENLRLWKEFVHTKAQELRDKGIIITSDNRFPIPVVNIIYPDEEWQASVEESSNSNWFDFEIGIYANNKKINLLPVLINLLKNIRLNQENIFDDLDKLNPEDDIMIRISAHDSIVLPADRVKRLLLFLKDLHGFQNYDHNEQGLKLSKAETLTLSQLHDDNTLTWKGSAKWQELVDKLKHGLSIDEVEEPKGLTVELRHYQHEGLRWLKFLQENQFGGILADDMGLGKTIQTLAHIMLAKEQKLLNKPVLIIAPTSVVFNWVKEIEKFTPNLKALLLYGNNRIKLIETCHEYDIILSTYPLILRDQAKLVAIDFYMIVLDEAQYIKNAQAKVTQAIANLKSEHRLCLTGTPMENHLGELWSLFHFLMPGFLGNKKQFQEFYRNPIERDHDTDRQRGLVKKIRPFILRRTKDDVLTELPEKTTITKYIELEQDQRDLYETIRVSVQNELMKDIAAHGLHKSQIAILDGLLKLRQVCCDPRLVKSETARKVQSSAKLDALKIMLKEMIEEKRKILLFSQFVEMLELIEQECHTMGIKYLKLTGESKNRDMLVSEFQTGNISLFLISLRAGGTGLNLTAADTIIQYDPWWNPAVEQQAASRAHRMGQEKPVFVYKMISKGTVEEKILAMQGKKQALADRLLSNQGTISTKLELEDIDMLFSAIV